MIDAWNNGFYCYVLHELYLKAFGRIVIEKRGDFGDRTPVVRSYVDSSCIYHYNYNVMPTFTLDATNPQPVCNTESLSETQIDSFKKWIIKNYVCIWRFWEGAINKYDVDKYLDAKHLGLVDVDENVDTESAEELKMKIREIENEIKTIVGPDPKKFYFIDPPIRKYWRIKILLRDRAKCLNKMFRCTPDEIKWLEVINERLRQLYLSLMAQADNLYRNITSNNVKDLGVECLVRAQVSTSVRCAYNGEDILTNIYKLEEDDDYYGSDFSYMTFVIQENSRSRDKDDTGFFHQDVLWRRDSDDNASLSPQFDDGHSWIFPYKSPILDHIPFCYLIHRLLDYDYRWSWSWPDLLRMYQYNAEVKILNSQDYFIDGEDEYKKYIKEFYNSGYDDYYDDI